SEGNMADAQTLGFMSPQLREVAEQPCRAGGEGREACCRKSRMVEISLSGSGEGPGWATSRGYSTSHFKPEPRQNFGEGDRYFTFSVRHSLTTSGWPGSPTGLSMLSMRVLHSTSIRMRGLETCIRNWFTE